MNLQHAKNNPGKFHEIRAMATKFDVKQGDYGPYALGTLKDEMGTTEKVLFATKKDESLIDACCAKELGIWGVRYDANTGNFKAYYNGAVNNQPQGQQAPQQAAQTTNPPQKDKAPSWQPLDRDHVQGNVICALLAARNRPKPEDVKKWTDYIMSGIHPDGQPQIQNNSQHVGDDPPKITDGDIPF